VLAGLGAHPSAHVVASATVSGYRIAFLVAAGFMLAAIAVLALFLRPRHLREAAGEGSELATALGV
jgi:hypothetical protein